MPNNIVKSYAKKTKKKTKTVEKMWDDTVKEVSEKYPELESGSSNFYAMVNSILKKKLKLDEIEEEATTTTTSANIGAGMSGSYARRVGMPSKEEVDRDDKYNKAILQRFGK